MLTLRKYQADAIDAMRQSFRSGKKRTVLMLPTGSGKTFIASEMIRSALARGMQRCLFVCDRIELINQTSERFAADGIDHGVIQAQHPCYAPEKLYRCARFRPWRGVRLRTIRC